MTVGEKFQTRIGGTISYSKSMKTMVKCTLVRITIN